MSSDRDTFLSKPRVNVLGPTLCNTWVCVCPLAWLEGVQITGQWIICFKVSRKKGVGQRQNRTRVPETNLRNFPRSWRKEKKIGGGWSGPWCTKAKLEHSVCNNTTRRLSFKESLLVCVCTYTPPPNNKNLHKNSTYREPKNEAILVSITQLRLSRNYRDWATGCDHSLKIVNTYISSHSSLIENILSREFKHLLSSQKH